VYSHRAKAPRHLPTSPFAPPVERQVEQFEVDDRVAHDQYGLGRVIAVESDIAVLVDFGTSRQRCVSPFDRLTKL
jgi:hypothetical protein